MRTRLLVVLAAIGCFAQMSAPRIGFVRDVAGSLRPVHGVAGAFVLGEAIVKDVVSAASSGAYTIVKTETEVLVLEGGEIQSRQEAPAAEAAFGFDAQGRPEWVRFAGGRCLLWANKSLGEGSCPAVAEPEASIDRDELVVKRTHARLRIPNDVLTVESIGPGWVVLRTSSRLYAVRTDSGNESLFELPEVTE